ncbi:MAG: ATP-dependent DNA helicase PcrA [Desulfobacteraceae bacterium]|nr:MAG: ATP-dependent DNA helicase PcrA [Desulfobacteraceae bacterium]
MSGDRTMNLEKLNEKQKDAVLAKGIVRVIAGAGSGKTRVLTHRIAYHVSSRGVEPSNILAVTFTRKAAFEMKERLKGLIGESNATTLNCGTFHSICLRILRMSLPDGRNLDILDDKKRTTFLKRVLGPEGVNQDLEVGRVGAIISLSKNRLIDEKGFSAEAEGPFLKKVAEAFRVYEEWKGKEPLLDYDDLLLRCWKLLKSDKRVLRLCRERFGHILVDEFQDTNLAQFEIIRLLTPPQENLFVVGDDWQSIYGWRGAAPENIIEFDRIFPKAVTIKLEQNYRSTKSILQSAGRLIAMNQVRTEKTIWTRNPEGMPVELIDAEDPEKEASSIIQRLKSLVCGNGTRFSNVSILYRTNAQSRSLEDECIRQKVPYHVVGSLGFYDRREIKDMIAYLRLIHDLNDDEAMLRIVNVPSRYLGKAFLKELEGIACARGKSLFTSLGGRFSRPYMGRSAGLFQKLILVLQYDYVKKRISLPELVKKIRLSTDYDHFICQDEEMTPDDSRIQNLNELESAVKRFERIEDLLFYVDQVKARMRETTNDDRVNLMTLHKSKGLEFAAVFVAGCSQGLLPHQRSLDGGDLEEERRLCYVGMTRAMERLYLSYPRTYQGKPMGVSQFVGEALPEVKKAGSQGGHPAS